MRILIDTSIVLDVLMARRAHGPLAVALVAGVDAIVSRDGARFPSASRQVFTPSAFLAAVRGDLR